MLTLLTGSLFVATGMPESLQITVRPTANFSREEAILIAIHGVPQGQRVQLEFARDCSGDNRPDFPSSKLCDGLIFQRPSLPSRNGIVQDRLVLDTLALTDQDWREGVVLGLRARYAGKSYGPPALFGIAEKPCSLLKSFMDVFFKGRCDPDLAQLLYNPRGYQGWDDNRFEVGYSPLHQPHQTVRLANTRRATGVVWESPQQLIYTLKGPERGGLYRFSLESNQSVCLLRGKYFKSPFLLNDQIGYVQVDKSGKATLHIQGITETWSLPAAFDQALGIITTNDIHVLGLYDNPDGASQFFSTALLSGQAFSLGSSQALFKEFFRRPGHSSYLKQMTSSVKAESWLDLIDGTGQASNWLKASDRHFILPAWSPEGGKIAYLTQ